MAAPLLFVGGPSLCVHSCSHGCHRPTRRCYKRPRRPRGCPILCCGGRRRAQYSLENFPPEEFQREVCQPSIGESEGGKGSIYRQNKILSGLGRESAVLFVAAACSSANGAACIRRTEDGARAPDDRPTDGQTDRYMVLCLRRQEVSESQTCCRVGRFDVDRLGEDDIHNEVVHSGYSCVRRAHCSSVPRVVACVFSSDS